MVKSLHGKGGAKNSSINVFHNGQPDGTISNDALIYSYTGPSHQVNSYYSGKSGKLDINANATYIWNKFGSIYRWKEESDTYENREVNTKNPNHTNMTAGKVVLGYPIGKGTLEGGAEATLTNTHSNYMNPENLIPSNRSDIKETNLAPFAEYSFSVGKWSFDAGLRYEHVNTNYRSNGVKEKEPSRTYYNIYPNVSAEWNNDDWDFSLGYAKKIMRPRYYALRNNVQYDGRFMYEAGNPYLRPNITHNVEFNAIYKWINFSLGYNYDKDMMAPMGKLYNGQEIALTRWENLKKYQTIYASLDVSPKFGFWQPTFELQFAKPFVSYKDYGVNKSLQRAGIYFEADNKYNKEKLLYARLYIRSCFGRHVLALQAIFHIGPGIYLRAVSRCAHDKPQSQRPAERKQGQLDAIRQQCENNKRLLQLHAECEPDPHLQFQHRQESLQRNRCR